MSTSSCHLGASEKAQELEKIKRQREAGLRQSMKRELRGLIFQGVVAGSTIDASLDAALHIDRPRMVMGILREIADELEAALPKRSNES